MLTALIIGTVLAVILGLGTGLVACCTGIVHRRWCVLSLVLLRLSSNLARRPAHKKSRRS